MSNNRKWARAIVKVNPNDLSQVPSRQPQGDSFLTKEEVVQRAWQGGINFAVETMNVELPLFIEYRERLSDLRGVIGRIDELSQVRPGLDPTLFLSRVSLLATELGSVAIKYQRAGEQFADLPQIVAEMEVWRNTVIVVRGRIEMVLAGNDDGSGLRKLYANLPANQAFEPQRVVALSRNRDMSAERKIVGQRARQLAHDQPAMYDCKGGMQRAGQVILAELRRSDSEIEKRGGAVEQWLAGFEGNLAQLGKEVSRAKKDYIKHYQRVIVTT